MDGMGGRRGLGQRATGIHCAICVPKGLPAVDGIVERWSFRWERQLGVHAGISLLSEAMLQFYNGFVLFGNLKAFGKPRLSQAE